MKHKHTPRQKRPEKSAEKKAELFQVGDTVEVDGKEGIVKEPNAPRGLIGISINGKYGLVEPEDAKIVQEAMNRLRRLAEAGYVPPEERMRSELHWLSPEEYKQHCQEAYDMGYRHGQNLRVQKRPLGDAKAPHSSFAGQYYYGIGLGDGHDGGPKRETLPLFENWTNGLPPPSKPVKPFEITHNGVPMDTYATEEEAMDDARSFSKAKEGRFAVTEVRDSINPKPTAKSFVKSKRFVIGWFEGGVFTANY